MSDTLKRFLLWIAIVAVLYAISQAVEVADLDGPRRPLPSEAPAWSNAKQGTPPVGHSPPQPSVDVIVQESHLQGDSIGTAFHVAPRTWITASHVIDNCGKAYVRVQGAWRAVERTSRHPTADVAVIVTAGAESAPRIGITDRLPVLDQEGFHFGFPQGVPSSLYTRFIGMARIRPGKPGTPVERGWIWAEQERSPATSGTLGGISGGPQVDRTGAVQGITILHSERSGRVTTAPIQRAEDLLADKVSPVAAGGTSIDRIDYFRHGNQVRGSGAVALVFCSMSGRTRPRS